MRILSSAQQIPIVARLAAATLIVVLSASSAADELVVRLDSLSIRGSSAGAGEQPAGSGEREPTTLRLPLVSAADGTVGISLRQDLLDEAVRAESEGTDVRIRLLAPATGAVSENERGAVSLSINAAVAFEDVAKGTSKTFDIEIRGAADSGEAYGEEIPIQIEGWRRPDAAAPVQERRKDNRSFWGTVSGRFEP